MTIKTLNFNLIGLIGIICISLLSSCASSDGKNVSTSIVDPTSRFEPSKANQAKNIPEDQKHQFNSVNRDDLGFLLNWNSSEWQSLNDPNDQKFYELQFFNEEKGLLAEIKVFNHSKGEAINLREKIKADQNNFELSNDKMYFTEEVDSLINGINGVFWLSAVSKKAVDHEIASFIFYSDYHYYYLSLSQKDKITKDSQFKEEWNDFFQYFSLSKKQEEYEAEYKQEFITPLTKYSSELYGFDYKNKDNIWYQWNSIRTYNSDPDLALINKDEDLFAIVQANYFEDKNLVAKDIFAAYLERWGIDINSEDLNLRRKIKGDIHDYTFTAINREEGKNYYYRGFFKWNGERSLMALSWTESKNKSEYQKNIDQMLNAISINDNYNKSGTKVQKQFNARILNHLGLIRLRDEQSLVALNFFEKANKADPEEPVYLINCGFVYQLKELLHPGIDHFTKQLALVKKHGQLLAILGEFHEAVRDYAAARHYYRMALKFYPNDQELIINLSDALWGLGQKTLSLDIVEKLYQKQPSRRLGIYLAKTLMGVERYSEAVDFLYMLKSKYPINAELGHTLTDALIYLNRNEEALVVNAEVVKLDGESSRTWLSAGKSQFYLKQFRNAEQSLLRALRDDPNDNEVLNFLSATRSYLGKSDIKSIQTPITPAMEKPKDLKTLVVPNIKEKYASENFPAFVHYQEEIMLLKDDNWWVNTEQQLIEVKDRRGISLFQEFTYSYLPNFDRIYVNTLEIYDSNMKLKTKAKSNQWYITSLKQDGSSGDAQLAHITVPAVEPGDFIYIQVSRTPIEKSGTVPFTHHICSKTIPVAKDVFKLKGKIQKIIYEDYGDIDPVKKENEITWTITDPVVIRNEKYKPTYKDYGSGILVAESQDWDVVGKNYLDLISHKIKHSLGVFEKARELQGTKRIDEELVFKFVDWVRKYIEYRDIAFGGHSLIPEESINTIHNRYGDCKDQSLLLKELLNAIGIEANLALVSIEDPVFIGLPSIQQFNHMIVYIPAKDSLWGDLYVDPSDESGTHRPVPLPFEDKTILVIDSTKSYTVALPVLEKDQEHKAFIFHRVTIDQEGHSQFMDSLVLHGKFAAGFRNQFLSYDKKGREDLIKNWLNYTFPNVVLTYTDIENVSEFNKPLIMKITFASDDYFSETENGFAGRVPNIWEQGFMKLPNVQNRHHPIKIPHEYLFISKTTILTPKGKQLVLLPQAKEPKKFDYIDFESKQEVGPNKIVIENKWKTYAVYADANEYDKLSSEWNFALKKTSANIELK